MNIYHHYCRNCGGITFGGSDLPGLLSHDLDDGAGGGGDRRRLGVAVTAPIPADRTPEERVRVALAIANGLAALVIPFTMTARDFEAYQQLQLRLAVLESEIQTPKE